MNKNLLVSVSHTDLDGFASQAILVSSDFAKKYEGSIIKHNINYDELDAFVIQLTEDAKQWSDKKVDIIFTDLSITEAQGDLIFKLSELEHVSAKVYDHHITTKVAAEKYPELIHLDTTKSATGIVVSEFGLNSSLNNEIVNSINAADIFIKEPAKWFRMGRQLVANFNQYTSNHSDLSEVREYVVEMLSGDVPEEIGGLYPWEHQVVEDAKKLAVSGSYIVRDNILLFKDVQVSISDLADGLFFKPAVKDSFWNNAINISRRDIAIVAFINEAKGIIEFRSSELDISGLAKKLGGGGHPKACGCPKGDFQLGTLGDEIQSFINR